MKPGFEKRQDIANNFSKKMIDDFANGNTQKYWQWLHKEEPLHWLLKNKGLAPQLAYERLVGAKEALLNISGRENKELFERADSNINEFIEQLDQELTRLAERPDIETAKEIFEYPLLPLPEQKEPLRKNNTANIPQNIERAIREVAFEKSKAPNSHAYQTMVDALSLYHATEMDGKKVSQKMDIPPNTFSGWKISVEEKLN